jgi:hypothetical protein
MISRMRGLVVPASIDWTLFLSSYAPLLVIYGIKAECPPWLPVACWLAAAVFSGLLLDLVAEGKRLAPREFPVLSASGAEGEVASYVASYLLPFLTTSAPTVREIWAYGLFIVLVGIVMTRSEMLHVNPLIYLTGYRVFTLRTTGGGSYYLISRLRPREGDLVRATLIRGQLLVDYGG